MDVDFRELFISTKGTAISQQEVEEAKGLIVKGLDILKGNK